MRSVRRTWSTSRSHRRMETCRFPNSCGPRTGSSTSPSMASHRRSSRRYASDGPSSSGPSEREEPGVLRPWGDRRWPPGVLRGHRVPWWQGVSRDSTRHDQQREAMLRRMERTMKDRIPRTDSIQELAAFWQNHDVTDFEDELQEERGAAFQRSDVVGVPLTADERQALRQAAARRGVAEAELIHEWVKARLGRT